MNRVVALLLAILLFGLVIAMAATEQKHSAESPHLWTLVVNITAQVLLGVGLILYCGFAALHSTQYIASPQERSKWLVFTIAGKPKSSVKRLCLAAAICYPRSW